MTFFAMGAAIVIAAARLALPAAVFNDDRDGNLRVVRGRETGEPQGVRLGPARSPRFRFYRPRRLRLFLPLLAAPLLTLFTISCRSVALRLRARSAGCRRAVERLAAP